MLPKTYAVIGAQYGDEGKGLVTDFIVHRLQSKGYRPTVVRANGGAQAAHTVVDGDRRHVFHHFGSGTFLGAPTHLSSHFIVNPIMFNKERQELAELGFSDPEVTIDPDALVTLPCDMLINQIVETVRGSGRHGSCGLGIGETIERSVSRDGFAVRYLDLFHVQDTALRSWLKSHRWLKHRLQQLGIEQVPEDYAPFIDNFDIYQQFWQDCADLAVTASMMPDSNLRLCDAVVFEGAQGLALDQSHANFPHVTRSSTGLTNVTRICEDADRSELEVIYVTRCYTTRHGAGPLANERDISAEVTVDDPTNVPNEWQGSLRFAPLDVGVLAANINRDLDRGREHSVRIAPAIAVTCLDQIVGTATIIAGSSAFPLYAEEVSGFVAAHCELPIAYESYGPTRSDVKMMELTQ